MPGLDNEGKKRLSPILDELREFCFENGGNTRKNVKLLFERYIDDDGSGLCDMDELMDAVMDLGIECSGPDMKLLKNYMDDDDSGTINFEEFFMKIQKPLTKFRGRLVVKAWNFMNRNKDPNADSVGTEAIMKLMQKNIKYHHLYINYGDDLYPREEILKEMYSVFTNQDSQSVNRKTFIQYWRSMSGTVQSDDDFGLMLSRMTTVAFIPSYSLKKAQKFMKRKIMGDGMNKVTNEEADKKLQAAFRKYDLNGDGVLEFGEFSAVLHDVGIILKENEAKALFDHYDDDSGGTISFPEFAKGVTRYVKPGTVDR